MAGRSLPRRDGHSSGTHIAARLEQPTRTTGPGNRPLTLAGEHRPYSVLLPVGLAMPSPLPGPRCALTAPFHPYPPMQLALLRRGEPGGLSRRSPEGRRRAVRSLWRFPWGRPRRTLSGTVFPWSPDFPPPKEPELLRERPSGRLAAPMCAFAMAPSSAYGIPSRDYVFRSLKITQVPDFQRWMNPASRSDLPD